MTAPTATMPAPTEREWRVVHEDGDPVVMRSETDARLRVADCASYGYLCRVEFREVSRWGRA